MSAVLPLSAAKACAMGHAGRIGHCMPLTAAFAVPGALETMTGGYFYDRRLVESLRGLGHDIRVITLPDGFPDPSPKAMAAALGQLQAWPSDHPLIVDGLAFGALPPDGVAKIMAPIIALVHHPLALETGLDAALAKQLRDRELHNLRMARQVIVPSPHTKAVLVAQYGVPEGKVTVLLPGIDRVQPEAITRAEPPMILSVGILHPRKGHDVLISALTRMADLDWQAVIVGNVWDTDHAATLQQMIAQSHVAGRIRLAGVVETAERDRLYTEASIFALATRYEGYGIVFNEALAQGLPIVTCRVGAVPDTVPAEAGLLVPVDDPDAFALALRQMLEQPSVRRQMAEAARAAGAALPSWDDMARRAEAVLSACIETTA